MNLLIMQFLQPPVTSSLFSPNILFNTLFIYSHVLEHQTKYLNKWSRVLPEKPTPAFYGATVPIPRQMRPLRIISSRSVIILPSTPMSSKWYPQYALRVAEKLFYGINKVCTHDTNP
jgi:hypothetical protein